MEHDTKHYVVYVKTDEQGRIIAVNSSAFLLDTDSWIEIDSGFGDRYHHAQGNYFEKPIFDERGICRYRLVLGVSQERTKEDMDADYVPTVPEASTEDLLLEMAADHEYRLCLIELGVFEYDL